MRGKELPQKPPLRQSSRSAGRFHTCYTCLRIAARVGEGSPGWGEREGEQTGEDSRRRGGRTSDDEQQSVF